MSDLTVHFSNQVPNLDDWANRLSLPLDIASLSKHYTAAHKYFRNLKSVLVDSHGWTDGHSDTRLLFTIEAVPPHRSSAGLPKSPLMTVSLPHQVSSFFSPERRVQWQMVFHSALFQNMRHTVQPVGALFYLLQCLVPGMLTLAKRENKPEGVWVTTRALPPPDWVNVNRSMLVEVFGSAHYKALFKAANDPQVSFKVSMEQS